MKYCQACGQQNVDDARFCEKCGANVAEAAGPAAPAKAADALAGAISVVRGNKMFAYGGIAVAAVILVWAVWSIFFSPMTAVAYGTYADKYTADISDSTTAIDAVLNDYTSYNDGSMQVTANEWSQSLAVIKKEEDKIKSATASLHSLRPPMELSVAHERILAWADFWNVQYLQGLDNALQSIGAGARYDRVSQRILGIWTTSMSSASGTASNNLNRANKDVSLSAASDNSGD